MTIQYGKCFEDYHPLFLEERTQAENPKAMARIARTPNFAKAVSGQVVRSYGAYHPDGRIADS